MKKTFFLIPMLFALLTNSIAQNTSPYWSLAGNSNASSSSKLGTTNNISLRFYTNNKQRMIINSTAGFVGIGTATPTELLHLTSPAGASPLRVQIGTSTRFLVHSSGGVSIGSGSTPPSNGLYVSGSAGIGTTTPVAKLDVRATANNTAIYAAADQSTAIYGTSFQGTGISGSSSTGYGVKGDSPEGTGVKASGQIYGVEASGDQAGVNCFSTDGVGLNASSTNSSGIVASTSNGTYAAEFNGKVFASSGYVTSDKNLKQNIHAFENAMSLINKLKPLNYEFKHDAKYEFLHLPKGTHYGLMAQDLEEILPNLVSEGKHELKTFKPVALINRATGLSPLPIVTPQQTAKESITIKAVNYVELIPIMIKGMQEQQTQIEKLSATNEALRSELDNLKSLILKSSNGMPTTSSSGYLKQNVPNPAKNTTVISYYLPENTSHAQIRVTDIKGSNVKVYMVSKGKGQMNLKRADLPAGTYNYTLYANDKQIDSKQMVIAK